MRAYLVMIIGVVIGSICLSSSIADAGAHWRFEQVDAQDRITSVLDVNGSHPAVARGTVVTTSSDVPGPSIPSLGLLNRSCAMFDGGWLLATSAEWMNGREFTIEFWAKFGNARQGGEVLAAKGVPGLGTWHILYKQDGSLQACIFGTAAVDFFEPDALGLVPGLWYHLAVSFQSLGNGTVWIRTYNNGYPISTALAAVDNNAVDTDLYISSFTDGKFPFHGCIDEFRIVPTLLEPSQLFSSGLKLLKPSTIVQDVTPLFVPASTIIDETLQRKAGNRPVLAEPEGYDYFCIPSTGDAVRCPSVPDGFDPRFRRALQGWMICKGGSPAGYHFAVKPGEQYVVAVGFYDAIAQPGQRLQHVVIDGTRVDTLDPAAEGNEQPFVRKYLVRDINKDGFLQVSCCHALEDRNEFTGLLNIVWIFNGSKDANIDPGKLARGECKVVPMYCVSGADYTTKGHIGFPEITTRNKAVMPPMLPMVSPEQQDFPQIVDPIHVTVGGDLADRIRTNMDRWGFCGRDQGIVAGFLWDSGYEVEGRYLDAYCKLARLMNTELDFRKSIDTLLERQDLSSRYPGSFVGGVPPRSAQLFGQGCVMTGLMAYYDLTGDERALEAAGETADWYAAYLGSGDLAVLNYDVEKGIFDKNDNIGVGQRCRGALEPIVQLYRRTGQRKYLDTARKIVELNRDIDGFGWMIEGNVDLATKDTGIDFWHTHCQLSTVHGWPQMYAATGEQSYLEDAIKAFNTLKHKACWVTGGVVEAIPFGGTASTEEVCATSDFIRLAYQLFDATGDNRFCDSAEVAYYNQIRYTQNHRGNFSWPNSQAGPQRGGEAWYCCGFRGANALYEVGSHLYASFSNTIVINGFMESTADIPLQGNTVGIRMHADIPVSGDISLVLEPSADAMFDLRVRIPSWAELKEVRINDKKVSPDIDRNHLVLHRRWKRGDRVDVHFDLPLRVVIDPGLDPSPQANVILGGSEPTTARYLALFRGPVILAHFCLAHGCDINWVYTGDHPDLFDATISAADIIDLDGVTLKSDGMPAEIKVDQTPDVAHIECNFNLQPGWVLKRVVSVHNRVPVKIDYASELTVPSPEAAASISLARMCGVRMRTAGFMDYRLPKLLVEGKAMDCEGFLEKHLDCPKATMDNGYVQFAVNSDTGRLSVSSLPNCAALYSQPVTLGNTLRASGSLIVTGESQWAGPVITR